MSIGCNTPANNKPTKCKEEKNPVIGLRWFKGQSLMIILYKDGTKKHVYSDPKTI